MVDQLVAGAGYASAVRPALYPGMVAERGPVARSLSERLKSPEPVSAQSALTVTASDLLTIC